jgi:arsenate reductase-like glutaredoxin family protein
VKAQEFLDAKKIDAKEVVDARKTAMSRDAALELAGKVDEIYAAKGSKIVHFDMKKDKPGKEDLLAVLLGPTGNLRAPTIVRGRKLIVGFNEEAYTQFLRG